MAEQQPVQPVGNDELLDNAEKFLNWARNNYHNQYASSEQVNNLALISLAASGIVIARSLAEQTAIMQEVRLPDITEGGER